jgi:hypothetical protein
MHAPQPSIHAFIPVIRHSGDSATGIDGIPYGVYRLIEEPASRLMVAFVQALFLCPHTVQVPAPLLVWIPKADAGAKADNWRPLGMPSTFHRLIAAGIYYHLVNTLPQLLHPSQALLNVFREPQGNFSDAQDFLHSRVDTASTLEASSSLTSSRPLSWSTLTG